MTEGQPDPGFRYWAFISYSHTDTAWARWLHKSLETYRVPSRLIGMPIAAGRVPARLSPIFRDRDELPTATDLGHTIEEVLRQSWCLIVICSRASAQSRWVNEEVLAFQRLGRAERIHCLIIDGAPDAGGSPCYPPALIETASGSHAPIAADARIDGDGKTHAKLKLIAGMLGVGFDKLVQREQQRRHRSMFVTTLTSLLVVVALSVFSVVTISSRRDAEAQRRHAEGLVEFMLGDLRQKLEPDGKLATLDAVGKEALAYYAAQDPASLDADALARRARALQQIGEVYNLRGRLDDALEVFKQAEQSTAELLDREPDNPTRIFDHAQSVFWVGYVAYQRGNIVVAEPQFQRYKELAERLVAIDPGNEDWQAEVGYAHANLGVLLYENGSLDAALNVFTNELVIARDLARLNPGNAAAQMRMAQAYAWRATVNYAQGQMREAAENRKQEAAIYESLVAINPKHHEALEALSASARSSAIIARETGDAAASFAEATRAVDLSTQLTTIDAENSRWLEIAASTYLVLADVHRNAGNLELARTASASAHSIASRLVQRDASVLDWQLRWIDSTLSQAKDAIKEDPFESLRIANGALSKIQTLPDSGLRSPKRTLLRVEALQFVADASRKLNRQTDAETAWREIARTPELEISTCGPRGRAALAIAIAHLGRSRDAIPIVESLIHAGYREPAFLASLELLGIARESAVLEPTDIQSH